MSRLMSVSLTEQQVRARTKTVTRRMGWLILKPGDHLTLCRKVMGRRQGEPLDRIADVEIIAVGRERLDLITPGEVTAEGFPQMTPAEFVEFFCDSHKGCVPASEVTRIEWRYLGDYRDQDAEGGMPPDDTCHYGRCRWPDGCNAEGVCIGREAAEGRR